MNLDFSGNHCTECPSLLSDLAYSPAIDYPPGGGPAYMTSPNETITIDFSIVNEGPYASPVQQVRLYFSPIYNDIAPSIFVAPLPPLNFVVPPSSSEQTVLNLPQLAPGEEQIFSIELNSLQFTYGGGPAYFPEQPFAVSNATFIVIDIPDTFSLEASYEDNRISIPVRRIY